MYPLVRRQCGRAPALARAYARPVEPHTQYNGYPELPTDGSASHQYRPPRGWDDQLLRRNFNDTVHHHEEVNSMWGPDIPVVPPQSALRQFLGVAGGFVLVGTFMRAFLVPEKPVVPREYPYNGLETELGGHQANPEAESSED
ncbi:hypothetical protein MIND_00254300 [Mycena indigotica]|uniref:Uncharacterized protein n=1 Tax=Mycena indigotica TaxID=2126181 RepID=A0A8H6T7W8_9AGAR|nr:uncharacterized protein MIND_00254300 [Mycena indigotica]KAF7312409.1 hypothetical protein MIND_00254300 [Mycena indigotica]